MRIAAAALLVAWSMAGGASPAHAAEAPSWSWLGIGKSAPSAGTAQASKTSQQQPSALSTLGNGTKRMASGTKHLLAPRKPPAKTRGVTATHRTVRHEPPRQGFFKQLFNPEPAPPPTTVGEWMSLKQVRP